MNLRVVQVEHDRCALAAVACLARLGGFELALEAAAVEQARQRIVVSQVKQLLVVASAVCDVLDLGEKAQRASIGVTQQGRLHRHPHRVPTSVNEALLRPIAADLAGKHAGDLPLLGSEVIGVGDRCKLDASSCSCE